ncbi:urease accessory protein UreD [Pelomonas sp. APW6]|uniref:Urease accessory protein UreD n=1 Tax=Roseateles subflavus TaxID=3053353 RepID=A0ABT7LF86_9BURK|nr:urease accessory protein UreD [Pelomonas sp. APW6]MDL5030300.1 urease accessory protein UreD [Pelomonas sp. APW6]
MPSSACPDPDVSVAPGGPAPGAGWLARLQLQAQREGERTVTRSRHHGPLRVLRHLYPEGPRIAHEVLVHPPSGLVGGDRLEIGLDLDAGSHVLMSTPGSTRFYRSNGPWAAQRVEARLGEGARLEWLPLETIAHPGCRARNEVRVEMAPGAELFWSEVLCLGLPASRLAFDHGCFEQSLDIVGQWRERALLDGTDALLLDSGPGLAGRRCLGTLLMVRAEPWQRTDLTDWCEASHALIETHEARVSPALGLRAGVTAPGPQVLLLRVLAQQAEPVQALLRATWALWRARAWGLTPLPPRTWSF